MKKPLRTPCMAVIVLLAVIISGYAFQGNAADTTSQEAPSWYYHSIVDVKFVKDHTGMPMPDHVMLIDARPYKPKYVKGHIPGAVNIPDNEFDKHIDLLPADKSALLIYYCEGIECKLSHKSAQKAEKLGYTNVKVFAKGYPEWKKAFGASTTLTVKAGEVEGSMDIAMFEDLLANSPEAMMIIDVRDKDEFDKGAFTGSVHIPVDDLENKIKDLPTDKLIVYVCSTGARSGEGYYMTKDVRPSLKDVYYLEAGCSFNENGSYKIKKTEG